MQLRMPWSRLWRKLANEMSISTCTQLITYMVHLSPSVQVYWSCNSRQALQSGGSSVTSTCGSLCLHALSFSPSYPCIRTSPKCCLLWEAFPIPAKAEVEMAVLKQKQTNKQKHWNLQTEFALYLKRCGMMYGVTHGNFFQVLTIQHSDLGNFFKIWTLRPHPDWDIRPQACGPRRYFVLKLPKIFWCTKVLETVGRHATVCL